VRKSIHQVDVEVRDARSVQLCDGRAGFVRRVNAPESSQVARIEALPAERNAIDTHARVAAEAPALHGAGIGLERDLSPGREAQSAANALENAADGVRREEARRPATEENARDRALCGVRRLCLQVPEHRIDVALLRDLALLRVRIEIAIRALAHAPRQVNVDGEAGNER
jgi:hypothetical protein